MILLFGVKDNGEIYNKRCDHYGASKIIYTTLESNAKMLFIVEI